MTTYYYISQDGSFYENTVYKDIELAKHAQYNVWDIYSDDCNIYPIESDEIPSNFEIVND